MRARTRDHIVLRWSCCRWFFPSSPRAMSQTLAAGPGHGCVRPMNSAHKTTFGYDGPHVTQLCIPKDRFAAVDLRQPLPADRKFDLAISCEVAEHLPVTSAATLVGTLTSLSDVALFSAAIPGQGGVRHVNEQWPAYWQALFRARNYSAYDLIRPRIWNDDRVEVWYRQNTVLYVADSAASRYHLPEKTPEVRGMVHPELYESQRRKKLLRNAVRSARRALARWTGRDNTR